MTVSSTGAKWRWVRHMLLSGFVAIQVFLIVTTSFEWHPTDVLGDNAVSAGMEYVGFVSGAANHYGFFAPGVVSQLDATYELFNARGERVGGGSMNHPINQGNIETTYRFHNMIENLAVEDERDKVRRSYAASWAVEVLRRNPRASKLRLTVKSLVLPSSAKFRSGERPYWEDYYTASFERPATGDAS